MAISRVPQGTQAFRELVLPIRNFHTQTQLCADLLFSLPGTERGQEVVHWTQAPKSTGTKRGGDEAGTSINVANKQREEHGHFADGAALPEVISPLFLLTLIKQNPASYEKEQQSCRAGSPNPTYALPATGTYSSAQTAVTHLSGAPDI